MVVVDLMDRKIPVLRTTGITVGTTDFCNNKTEVVKTRTRRKKHFFFISLSALGSLMLTVRDEKNQLT